MSALTEIFNHLFAYLIVFVSVFFDSGTANIDYLSPNVQEIVLSIVLNLNEEQFVTIRPIVWLSTGIFACGAIIGLAKRLIK